MTETAQATRIGAREGAAVRAWIAAHWFGLGVAALAAAAAAFLLHQLLAWPPHEDETLPLFVGRHPLGELFQVVLEERGGAPLHFLLAWAVAHLGFGLEGLRALSALFAVASIPVVALLAARLAGRVPALVATVIVASSWTFLFHGVYGRMYSLFLFTSALSYLALLRALERGGRRAWALWALAILATVATHPYGALVLASQAVFVLVARRDRMRAGALGLRRRRRPRHPVLAHRPRARRPLRRRRRPAAGGSTWSSSCGRREATSRAAFPVLPARARRGGGRASPSCPGRRALLAACAAARAARSRSSSRAARARRRRGT